jgi:hypothetical protein
MASFARMVLTAVGLVSVALVPVMGSRLARAQNADATSRLKEQLKREPKAPEVVKMALDYFKVAPAQLEAARSSARSRALLPVVSGFIGYNVAGASSATVTTITNPNNVVQTGAQNTTILTGGLAWDLRELVFNPAEIQTYGIVPIQKDITLDVVRTYYLRRQLQIRLAYKPPEDPLAVATLELRVEEYTGILNAMTGGGFSRAATPAPASS